MDDQSRKASLDLIQGLVGTPDQSPYPTLLRLLQDASPVNFNTFDSGFADTSPQKILLPGMSMEDQPVFVNPKQYHRILKRRIARSKLKPVHRKPFLHESRSTLAKRRQRDDQGMFLGTSKKSKAKFSGPDA